MRLKHEYGEEMYIDFTGTKLLYKCSDTGKTLEAEILVKLLGGSSMFHIEALRSQKVGEFTLAVSNAFCGFGGTPRVLIPDNLKFTVTSAYKYQPVINDTFLSMTNHYGAVVSPARLTVPVD